MSEGGPGEARGEEVGSPEGSGFRPWLLAGAVGAGASVAFWWAGMGDAAFVAAALGVVAWFMNQRSFYRKIRDENEHVEDDPADEHGDAGWRE
ncbi:MAG TPA: hypothetical protein VEY09_05505 [Pyrinomonadaceae bacterium]|nr:hypothetical protein [Pyrinomonadaceae bacterium]